MILAALSGAPLHAATVDTIVAATDLSFIFNRGGEDIILAVQALDGSNTPIPNPEVNWQSPSSPPMATLELGTNTDTTNAGYSYVALRNAAGNGTYQVTATYGASTVVFTIENRGFGVTRLIATGADQSAVIGTAFSEPLTVTALDASGRPVAGQLITFTSTAVAAGATFGSGASTTMALTNASGVASVSASANSFVGLHNVTISTVTQSNPPPPVSLRLSNLAEVPAAIQYVSGTPQQTAIRTVFADDLFVRVVNAAGQAMANVAVEVTAPLTGATFSQVQFRNASGNLVAVPGGGRMLTDTAGRIRALVTANDVLGTFTAQASFVGGASPVSFSLTNTAPVPTYILGNGSEAVMGEFAKPDERFTNIAFRVLDSNHDPVGEGVPVTLTYPSDVPSVRIDQPQMLTDAEGWVRTQGTALGVGTYYVTATAPPNAQGRLLLQNRPVGYNVGEQLADAAGEDHAGQKRTLRSALTGGSYLLLDVCTSWCVPCRSAQPLTIAAKASLQQRGIPLTFVPLLIEGPNRFPSTQLDALAWFTEFNIPDFVLHASGEADSEFYQAGQFVMGVTQPVVPSYLLVGPDGTILERFSGVRDTDELVRLVVAHVPGLSVADVTVNESAGNATVTVTRSSSGSASTVNFTTVPGTAGATDFSARSGVLSFSANQLSATVVVPIANDAIDESAETFSLSLSNAVGAVISDGTGVITIADDDPTPELTIDDVRGAEGTGSTTPFTIPLHLDRPSAFSIVVSYAMVAGTATSKDVVLTSSSITIPSGQTTANITASVIGDALIEPKETFGVVIKSATNATIADAQSLVSIVDDDSDTVAPKVASKADVIVEVKMSLTATIVVSCVNPSVVDNVDGGLATTCTPPSGSKFPYGRTTVNCTAEDRAGNLGSTTFGVVVRLPTIGGAVFPADGTTSPLTEVHPGQDVEVRVNAGAFTPRAKVQLTFIDSSSRAYDLHVFKAGNDGSFQLRAEIPGGAAPGLGQMLAQSNRDNGDEYDRAWTLLVVPR